MINQSDSIAIKDIIHDTIPKFIGLVKPNADTLNVMLVPTDWKALWFQVIATGFITGLVSLAIAEYTVRKSKKHALEEIQAQDIIKRREKIEEKILKLRIVESKMIETTYYIRTNQPTFIDFIQGEIPQVLYASLAYGAITIGEHERLSSKIGGILTETGWRERYGMAEEAMESIRQIIMNLEEEKNAIN